jgi:hypothetical protein
MIFMTTVSSFLSSESDEVNWVLLGAIGGVAVLIQPDHTCCLKIYTKVATPLRETSQSWRTDKRPKIRPLTYIVRFSLAVEEEAWSTGGVGGGPYTTGDREKEIPCGTRAVCEQRGENWRQESIRVAEPR